jgi:putative tryptophan/tyrosine transport system substrate-binding protein
MIDRRAFACCAAFGICAAPLAVHTQTTGKMNRIGILSSATMLADSDRAKDAWVLALRDLGWVEGRNVILERRYSDGKSDLLPGFARELIQAKVDVIVTFASSDTTQARRATSTIPIVMVFNGLDPVEEGFVASFARPGGNITGVSRMLAETRAKRLEFIRAVRPSAGRVAVLAPPQGDARTEAKFENSLRAAARVGQVELQFFYYKSQDDLMAAFPAMDGARMHAFLLEPTFQTFGNRDRIAELALKHRLPGVFSLGEYAAAGGLLSYGPDWSTMMRQHARLVDRILRGANPGELPMEQPTKFEMVINLNTAKALGLTIPQSVLLRADKVIQ